MGRLRACLVAFRKTDARFFQIAFLSLMLVLGVLLRDFPISLSAVLVCLGGCWLFQTVFILGKQLPWSSLLSATISGISLCLLCRSQSLSLLGLAALATIASKFVFVWRGKHFFNPTNFGVVVVYLFSDGVWISPAQWGESLVMILWLGLLGMAVVHSAWRFDISAAFLGTVMALLALRVNYLGQPWAVFWHQLNSGALILFTFFMISDPRSTPDHRRGRVAFAVAVALLFFVLRFRFYHPQALLLSLFFLSPITVALDWLWKAQRYRWFIEKEYKHASPLADPCLNPAH